MCTGCNCELHHDLQLGGWRWFCTNRRRSVPSVQLYQELKELQNTKIAFSEFAKEHKLLRPMNLDTLVAEYEAGIQLAEFNENTWQTSAKYAVNGLDGKTTETLERLGLWYATPGNYPAACGMLVGHLGGSKGKSLLKGMMPVKGLSTRINLYSMLTVPFECSPGQISSLVLLDNFDRSAHRALFSTPNECGLMGLRYINNRETLFVVLDPLLYLFVQSQSVHLHNTPLNMVCASNTALKLFECQTNETWKNIFSHKVIFWDYGRSPDAVNHARKLGKRGYIAMEPTRVAPSNGPVKFAIRGEMPLKPHRLESSAKPWAEAFKLWVLDASPSEQEMLINSMVPVLGDDELQEIEKYCSPLEWQKIKVLLKADTTSRVVSVQSNRYIFTEGKGVSRMNAFTGEQELVADVTMDIQAQGVVGSQLYLRGQIDFYGNKIEFFEKDETLRNSVKDWLTVKCGQRFGLPVFGQIAGKNLLDIYKQASNTRTIMSASRFGYQEKNTWELPGLRYEEGEIREHTDPQFFDFCPGSGLSKWVTRVSAHTNRRMDLHGFPRTSADPYYVASAVILHNLLAPRVGTRQLGLFVAGDPAPILHIAQDARLLQFRFVEGNDNKEYTRLRDLEQGSDIPVVVPELRDGAAFHRWATLRNHNAIVIGGTDHLFKLLGHPDWVVVRVPTNGESLKEWSPARLVLSCLQEWKPGDTTPENLFDYCMSKIWEGDVEVNVRQNNTHVFSPPLHERMFMQGLWALDSGYISVPSKAKKNEPIYRSKGAYIIQPYLLQSILNKVGAITTDPLDVLQSASRAGWRSGEQWYEVPAEAVYKLTAKFKRYHLGFVPTET